MSAPLKIYQQYAHWWPLFSPREDYAEEAHYFLQILQNTGLPEQPHLLELGAGGGHTAFYLKEHFAQTTLVDLSAEMLKVSQQHNPDCEHLQGDMCEIQLPKSFDVVFIHDAIDYLTSREQLQRCFENAARHLKTGGLLLLVPDHVKETFSPHTEHGGADGEGRSMRYLEWSDDPNPTDSQCITDFVFIFRKAQEVETIHERHVFGLFPQQTWLDLLSDTGFQAQPHVDQHERVLFVGQKT